MVGVKNTYALVRLLQCGSSVLYIPQRLSTIFSCSQRDTPATVRGQYRRTRPFRSRNCPRCSFQREICSFSSCQVVKSVLYILLTYPTIIYTPPSKRRRKRHPTRIPTTPPFFTIRFPLIQHRLQLVFTHTLLKEIRLGRQ